MSRGACLLCFAVNVKTFNISNTHLQYAYEEIAAMAQVQSHARILCYICYAKLQQCHNLIKQALNVQMSLEEKPQVECSPLIELSTVNVLDAPITYKFETIKQEQDDKENSSHCIKVELDLTYNEENCEVKQVEGKPSAHETTVADKKIFSCNICDRHFKRGCHLNKHKLTHGIKKSYSCDICQKKFIHIGYLDRHKETHGVQKSNSCDICKKTFSQRYNLDVHKLTHIGIKQYSCDVCQKKFSQRGSLNRHIQIHNGTIKKYSCDICDKKFSQKGYLNVHKHTHTDTKQYSCDVCEKKYSQRCHLKVHKQSHHAGLKPHSCEICKKKFCQRSSLNRHKRVHTGVNIQVRHL